MRRIARKPAFVTALLVLVALVFAGCVLAQRDTLIRYDGGQDLFAVLNINRGISADAAVDLDHLESLWRDRARIYNVPFIGGLAIFDAPALRRTADGKFEWVSLAKATTQPAAIRAAASQTGKRGRIRRPGPRGRASRTMKYAMRIDSGGRIGMW